MGFGRCPAKNESRKAARHDFTLERVRTSTADRGMADALRAQLVSGIFEGTIV